MSRGEAERRSQPRYNHRLTLRAVSGADGLIEMESANIGPGGAYCISPRAFDEMTCLEVMLFLPGGQREGDHSLSPLRIASVVVRSEPADGDGFNVALFFPNLSPEQRSALTHYLPAGAREGRG